MSSRKQTAPCVQAGVRQAPAAGLGHPVPWQKGPPCHPVPAPLPVPRQRRWDRVGSWMGCAGAGRGGQSVGAACLPPFWRCCEPLCLQKRERRAGSEGSSVVFTSAPLPAETSSDPVCGFIGGRGRKTTLKSSLREHVRRGKTFPYLLSVDY